MREHTPTVPPPRPPALEPLRERTDEIVRKDAPLTHYVRHDTPADETPFLADKPFGDHFAAGQMTPFFLNDAPAFDFDTEDTEGIPTGLPNLRDLPPLATPAPAPRAAEAPVVAEVSAPAVVQAPAAPGPGFGVGFVAGLVAGLAVAALVWSTL